MEVAVPKRVGAACDGQRLGVGLGHDHEASQAQHGSVRALERRAVAVGHRANLGGQGVGDQIEAVAARGLGAVGRPGAGPERRVRLLQRLELHRHVGIAIELAVKRERALGERLAQDLQRFEVHFLSVIGIDPVIGGFDRRDAAADAQLEAAPAELVEHADLLD